MKIAGSSTLHAAPEQVWAAITDPAVLAGVIPGCDELTPIEPGRFALTVSLGVASIKGSYSGEVAFSDLQEPTSLTMRARGSGGPGTIDTTVAVALAGQPDGTTRLVVRERYRYLRWWAPLLVEPVEFISLVMSRRMLRGIKERAARPVVATTPPERTIRH